ncbi:DUF1353 domain-containing protein [Palleronia caenipelagi]|uniref:DUF1353 domain-containing protein n=1 Tax=Palleronia caenipelagi TaxID=2489174 RepID=A0A547Q9B0_9RHOB|nr:DUF1353 domain-containing protein [Palleronia caenipelagi]TRD22953.1 DUF1353 domain-containing protein [Palleronia caenipelagi]
MTHTPDTSWCRKGGRRSYVTTKPLPWWIGKENSGWLLTVPEHREFESSVPRSLQWVWSPDDPYYLKSAAIHDTLLEEGFREAFADSQWFEAALSEHAPTFRTWVAYSAMRARRFLLWVLGMGRP